MECRTVGRNSRLANSCELWAVAFPRNGEVIRRLNHRLRELHERARGEVLQALPGLREVGRGLDGDDPPGSIEMHPDVLEIVDVHVGIERGTGGEQLVYASRMSAKVDSAAVQDGRLCVLHFHS